jgi:hypothetical protein
VEFTSCPAVAESGGDQIMVSGLPCDVASRLPLHLGDPFGRYDEPQELVYRPRDGDFSDWTCWARFEPDQAVVNHLCWNSKAVLRFRTG